MYIYIYERLEIVFFIASYPRGSCIYIKHVSAVQISKTSGKLHRN